MIRLIILEGARGSGKSETARILRSTLPTSTLINFTGFKDDGEDGLNKVFGYYQSWLKFFSDLAARGGDYVFICDRIFISEMVYSELYKGYDFNYHFGVLLYRLLMIENMKVDLIHVTVDEKELPVRLKREKSDHFAQFEKIEQVKEQQVAYKEVISSVIDYTQKLGLDNISFHNVDTTNITPSGASDLIKNSIK
ncbi:hypothetical protein [Paenibacillus sp. MMO-177]|uniref:hypothetical protein n=1 Tax=Paenibacillus sp. MMO-177 TaxID=3081289 RepID=UPI00301A8A7F